MYACQWDAGATKRNNAPGAGTNLTIIICLTGGEGDDYLEGGDGDDFLYGDDGDDKLYGGEGADALCHWHGTGYVRVPGL